MPISCTKIRNWEAFKNNSDPYDHFQARQSAQSLLDITLSVTIPFKSSLKIFRHYYKTTCH